MRSDFKLVGALTAVLMISGCNQQPVQGGFAGPVSGSAGGSTSIGAANGLRRCSETLGTLAVDDGRQEAWWGPFTQATQITTIEPMVRLVVQQSNCFIITSAGNSDLERRMSGITALQRNGEFRAGSNQQKGQRVAADYFLQPAILFANANTGGIAGGLGSAFGTYGAIAGGLVGGLSQNSTSVTMSMFDIRAGVQIAASEGSASASNFGALLGGFGGGTGGALGAYSRTPAGQSTVAAFVDAYNKMVDAVSNYKAQTVRGGSGTGGLLKPN